MFLVSLFLPHLPSLSRLDPAGAAGSCWCSGEEGSGPPAVVKLLIFLPFVHNLVFVRSRFGYLNSSQGCERVKSSEDFYLIFFFLITIKPSLAIIPALAGAAPPPLASPLPHRRPLLEGGWDGPQNPAAEAAPALPLPGGGGTEGSGAGPAARPAPVVGRYPPAGSPAIAAAGRAGRAMGSAAGGALSEARGRPGPRLGRGCAGERRRWRRQEPPGVAEAQRRH